MAAGRPFARGKKALGICDRCGLSYKLDQLRTERHNLNITNLLVCPECWDPDHPQNWQGRIDYSDPQALRNPRVDTTPGTDRSTSTTIAYEFRNDLDDWRNSAGCTVAHVDTSPFYAQQTNTGDTLGIMRLPAVAPLSVDASKYTKVQAMFRVDTLVAGSTWFGQIGWWRDIDAGWVDILRIPEPTVNQFGEKWHVLEWDLRNEANWTSTIEGLYILTYYEAGNVMDFNYIRFEA